MLDIGPLTIHYYALCIITGIAVAVWLGDRRFRRDGMNLDHVVADVAIVAVPFGILGGRIYHVITSPQAYFGKNGNPIDAFKIWEGGLGIWGAIALGILAAYFRYRGLSSKRELPLPSFLLLLDALAPGVLFAQAIGRFGNWFNGELFGRPLSAPWSLAIPSWLRPVGYTQYETFHPTFLYEALWCTSVAIALIVIGKKLNPGQVFFAYIAAYCLGRFFIESIRIDDAHHIFGLRLNQWVSLLVGLGAGLVFVKNSRASSRL